MSSARGQIGWRHILGWAAFVAAGCLPLACGSAAEDDCVAGCEAGRSCPSPVLGVPGRSCEEVCAQALEVAEEAGCEDAFAEMMSCASEGSNVCDIEAACATELPDYATCFAAYCLQDPEPPSCAGLSCTYRRSGSAPNCSVSRECTDRVELDCVSDSEPCTCSKDGSETGTVDFDSAFCDDDMDTAFDAAAGACGWER